MAETLSGKMTMDQAEELLGRFSDVAFAKPQVHRAQPVFEGEHLSYLRVELFPDSDDVDFEPFEGFEVRVEREIPAVAQ